MNRIFLDTSAYSAFKREHSQIRYRGEPTIPEYMAKHPPEMEPAHPGKILREDVLPALNLKVTEAARQLRVSRQMLHSILAERSAVSPEMAVRLGKFCGNGEVVGGRVPVDHHRIDEVGHGAGGVAVGARRRRGHVAPDRNRRSIALL